MFKLKSSLICISCILFLNYTGNGQQALQDRMYAKKLLLQNIPDTLRVKTLNNLGFTYIFEQSDSGIQYIQRAKTLADEIHYETGSAVSSAHLSIAYMLKGETYRAIHYAYQELAIGQKLKNGQLILGAYNDLLTCYREIEDYKNALKFGYEGLSYFPDQTIPLFMKKLTLGFISSVYERDNQLDSAELYGLKSYHIDTTWHWPGLKLTLGNIYLKLKQREKAFDFYKKGIVLAEDQLVYIDLIDIYNKMSVEFETMGLADSAFYYAQKSLNIRGIDNYLEGHVRAIGQLARLYEKSGDTDSTIHFLKKDIVLRNQIAKRQTLRETNEIAFQKKSQASK